MARVIVMVLAALLASSSEIVSQTYWIAQSRPTTRDLRTLSFLDSLNGWVAGDSGTILRTTDGGATWTSQNSGISDAIVDIFMLNERRGWAVAPWYIDTTIYTNVLSTTNGGDTWQSQYWDGDYLTSVYFRDSLVGWMSSGMSRIFRTTDGGSTWTEADIVPGPFARFPVTNLKFYSSEYGFAMGGRIEIVGVVWRTTNGGQTWTGYAAAPEPVVDLHFIDSLRIIGVFTDPDYLGAGVITTTDGGDNWQYRYLDIWGDAKALAVRTPAEMWCPLGFAGTYMYSFDSGSTWDEMYTPDSTAMYDAVFTDERTGYMVGSQGAVLKYNSTTDVDDDAGKTFPLLPYLHQNYPNPFNVSTKIRFDVHRAEFVSLRVFNVFGQEISTIVEETKPAGSYEVTFHSATLASGMYIYRLTVGRVLQARKMILLR
jgi:photosystem II stability/assembly factor-like uncharacterized protein